MEIYEILAERGEVITEMKSLLDTAEQQGRDLNKAEQSKYDGLFNKQQSMQSRADRLEVTNGLHGDLDKLRSDPGRPTVNGQGSDARNAAELNFLRTGAKSDLPQNALSVGTDSEGGYTFLPHLSKTLIETIAETNPILGNVSRESIDMSNEFLKVFTVSGASSGRVLETVARSETDTQTFARQSVSLSIQYAYPRITEELLHSSQFDLEGYIAREIATAFDADWEAEMLTGSGTAPAQKGILTAADSALGDATRDFGSYQLSVTAAGTNAVTSDELLDLMHSLPSRYRRNAKFYCSTSAINALRKLKDTDTRYLLHGMGQAGNESLGILGHEIVEVSQMPALAASSKSIMFGDLAQAYSFVSHNAGLHMSRDPYTTPGYVKFYTRLFCGSGPMDTRALKVMQQAAA